MEGIVQGEETSRTIRPPDAESGDSQISAQLQLHKQTFMGVCKSRDRHRLEDVCGSRQRTPARPRTTGASTPNGMSFRSFFSSSPEPETGRHLFVFRFLSRTGPPRPAVALSEHGRTDQPVLRPPGNVAGAESCAIPSGVTSLPQLLQVALNRPLPRPTCRLEIRNSEGLVRGQLGHRRRYYMFGRRHGHPVHHREHAPHREAAPPALTRTDLRPRRAAPARRKKPFSISEEGQWKSPSTGRCPVEQCWNRASTRCRPAFPLAGETAVATNHPVVPQDNISEFLDKGVGAPARLELYRPTIPQIMGRSSSHDRSQAVPRREGSLLTLEVQNTYETVHGEFVLPSEPGLSRRAVTSLRHTLPRAPRSDRRGRSWRSSRKCTSSPKHRLWFMEPERP